MTNWKKYGAKPNLCFCFQFSLLNTPLTLSTHIFEIILQLFFSNLWLRCYSLKWILLFLIKQEREITKMFRIEEMIIMLLNGGIVDYWNIPNQFDWDGCSISRDSWLPLKHAFFLYCQNSLPFNIRQYVVCHFKVKLLCS